MPENVLIEDTRKLFIRPLIISLFFAVAGELLLLVIYGIILFPGGNMIYKVLWTLVFCGIGMGQPLVPALISSLSVVTRVSKQFC